MPLNTKTPEPFTIRTVVILYSVGSGGSSQYLQNELEKADDNLEKHVKKISEKCSVTRQHKTDLKKGTIKKVQYQEDLVKCDKVAADHDITNKNNNNPRKLSIEDSKLLCRTCFREKAKQNP